MPSVAAPLLSIAGLFFTGAGVLGLTLPLRGALEGFPTAALGLLGTACSLGFVLGCLVVPSLARRFGRVQSLRGLALLLAASALLSGMIVDPWPWFALRIASGFAIAGASMLIESWLSELAAPGGRGRMLGRYTVVNLVATLSGQLLLIGLDLASAMPFLVVAGSALLACGALGRGQPPTPVPAPVLARPAFGAVLHHSPIAAAVAFAIGLGNSTFGSLGPVWAEAVGFDVEATALLVTLAAAGGAASQWPVGRLSDGIERVRLILLLALAAVAATCLMVLPTTWSPGTAGVAFLVVGAVVYAIYPVASAHAYDRAGTGAAVGVASGLLLLFGAGASIGPIASAAAMAAWGERAIWGAMGGAYAVIVLAVLVWLPRRRQKTATDIPAGSAPRLAA